MAFGDGPRRGYTSENSPFTVDLAQLGRIETKIYADLLAKVKTDPTFINEGVMKNMQLLDKKSSELGHTSDMVRSDMEEIDLRMRNYVHNLVIIVALGGDQYTDKYDPPKKNQDLLPYVQAIETSRKDLLDLLNKSMQHEKSTNSFDVMERISNEVEQGVKAGLARRVG